MQREGAEKFRKVNMKSSTHIKMRFKKSWRDHAAWRHALLKFEAFRRDVCCPTCKKKLKTHYFKTAYCGEKAQACAGPIQGLLSENESSR